MLTWNRVLQRIQDELVLPNHVLEKADSEIQEYLTQHCLPKFEQYYPDKNAITIDCSDTTYQVTNKQNEFYIYDPDEREIYDLLGFYTGMSTSMVLGKQVIAPLSWDSVPSYELSNMIANNTEIFSAYNYHIEFVHPNIMRVLSDCNDTEGVVHYERAHDTELSTIPKMFQDMFIELCLGMFMRNIGRIRTRYANIATAFGEISLNGEDLRSEGREIYDVAMEELKRTVLPCIMMDRG